MTTLMIIKLARFKIITKASQIQQKNDVKQTAKYNNISNNKRTSTVQILTKIT